MELHRESEQINFRVCEMPVEGLAKLRHVAGWAIRKELERCRRHIRQNIYSQSSETRQNLNVSHAKCQLLEENVIVQYSWLKDNTSAPGTLEVTEDRQYRERGLLHISDEAFSFFQLVEGLRVEQMNMARIMSSDQKGSFVDTVIEKIQRDGTVAAAWKAAFTDVETDKAVST